jgi:hypothetical protein
MQADAVQGELGPMQNLEKVHWLLEQSVSAPQGSPPTETQMPPVPQVPDAHCTSEVQGAHTLARQRPVRQAVSSTHGSPSASRQWPPWQVWL